MGQGLCGGPDQVVESKVPFADDIVPQKTDDLEVKLLLLGAGESGKSTLFKQMKINYSNDYNETLLLEEKERIIAAFLQSFGDLLHAIYDQHSTLGDPEKDETMNTMFPYKESKKGEGGPSNNSMPQKVLTPGIVSFVKDIWNSKEAKEIWENRANYQITESLAYFVESVDRLASKSYMPTEDDYLRCRIISTGIVEQTFTYNQVKMVVVDVGGQRAERKKWIRCFDGVNAVIFVAAVSEFNQKLFEDNNMSRTAETEQLFQNTVKFRVFRETPFALFLNKVDLLELKLKNMEEKGENLDDYFPQLNLGTDNYDVAAAKILKYTKDKFESMANPGRVHTTYITATDRGAFTTVFSAAAQVILSEAVEAHFGSSP